MAARKVSWPLAAASILIVGAGSFSLGFKVRPSTSAQPAVLMHMASDRGLSYDTLYLPLDIPDPKLKQDLQFDKQEGATSVYISANESDAGNGVKLTKTLVAAHAIGLRVFLDPYIGGTFSGDEGNSAAAYLRQHPASEIVSRDGVRAGVASVNDGDYIAYIEGYLATFLTYDFDGILLDEPTMAVPDLQEKIAPGDYFPYDGFSRALFRSQFHYEMPASENADVVRFREQSMQHFVEELLSFTKQSRPDITTILDVLAHPVTGGDFVGTGNWRAFAAMPALDVLETDPYWYLSTSWPWFVDNVNSLMAAVQPYKKRCGVWVRAFGMSGYYETISRSLRFIEQRHVPWSAVWVTFHLPNTDMTATWQQIASVYRSR